MSQAGSRVALQVLRGLIASGRLEPVLGACGTGMRTFSTAHDAHQSTFGSLSVSPLTSFYKTAQISNQLLSTRLGGANWYALALRQLPHA